MKNLYKSLVIIFLSAQLLAQNNLRQQVDYNIYVKLDTQKKELQGVEEITYHNNSNQEIDKIYINLWANAYSSRNSSYFKEMQESFNMNFALIKKSNLGGYKEIKFHQKDKILNIEYSDDDRQIAIVNLNEAVHPHDSVHFTIEFVLKIPKDIDGFGYSGGQYNFTNWYPKICTYSEGKWHPYQLNYNRLQYSEFGNYNVTIWAPKYKKIVAPGYLVQNYHKSENDLLKKFAIEDCQGNTYNLSNTDDFSWYVLSNIEQNMLVFVDDNKNIYSVTFYSNLGSIISCNEDRLNGFLSSFINFSSKNGLALKSPTLSIISTQGIVVPRFSKGIVTMEHMETYFDFLKQKEKLSYNLFRMSIRDKLKIDFVDSPWISDGLASFLFRKHIEEVDDDRKYHSHNYVSFQKLTKEDKSGCFCDFKPATLNLDSYETLSEYETYVNRRTAKVFNYIDKIHDSLYLSQVFKKVFSQLPDETINPSYFTSKLNEALDCKDNWLIDGLLGSELPYTYTFTNSIKENDNIKVKVKNEGKYSFPYKIDLYNKRSLIDSKIVSGHPDTLTSFLTGQNANLIKLHHDEIEKNNNGLITRSLIFDGRCNPVTSNFPETKKTRLNLFPMPAINMYDGFQAGLTFSLKNKKIFESGIGNISYGFRSKSFVGLFKTTNSLQISSDLTLLYGISANSYNRYHDRVLDYNLKYFRFSPYVKLNLNSCNLNKLKKSIEYQFTYISDQNYDERIIDFSRYVNEISFVLSRKSLSNNKLIKISLENQYFNYKIKHNHILLTGEYVLNSLYKKNKYINLRLYGSAFLYNSHYNSSDIEIGSISLTGNSLNDYKYQYPYIVDRSADGGFWVRQIINGYGGFKNGIAINSGIGVSNKYIVSANLSMDLPFMKVIKPFADFGIYGNTGNSGDKKTNFLYSAGIEFDLFRDYFKIYIPVINSRVLEDYYSETYLYSLLGKISFSLNINELKF